MKADRLASIALGLGTLVMTGLGLIGLVAPAQLLEPLGISLSGTQALNELRATYGAVHLVLAAAFAYGAFREAARVPALALLAAMTGGILAVRFASFGIDGLPGPGIYKPMVVEVLLFVLASVSLQRSTAGTVVARAQH